MLQDRGPGQRRGTDGHGGAASPSAATGRDGGLEWFVPQKEAAPPTPWPRPLGRQRLLSPWDAFTSQAGSSPGSRAVPEASGTTAGGSSAAVHCAPRGAIGLGTLLAHSPGNSAVSKADPSRAPASRFPHATPQHPLNRSSNQSVRPSAQLGNTRPPCRAGGAARRLRPTREPPPRSEAPSPLRPLLSGHQCPRSRETGTRTPSSWETGAALLLGRLHLRRQDPSHPATWGWGLHLQEQQLWVSPGLGAGGLN